MQCLQTWAEFWPFADSALWFGSAACGNWCVTARAVYRRQANVLIFYSDFGLRNKAMHSFISYVSFILYKLHAYSFTCCLWHILSFRFCKHQKLFFQLLMSPCRPLPPPFCLTAQPDLSTATLGTTDSIQWYKKFLIREVMGGANLYMQISWALFSVSVDLSSSGFAISLLQIHQLLQCIGF